NQNFAAVATETDHLRQQVEVVNECAFETRNPGGQRTCGFGLGGVSITAAADSDGLIAPLYIPQGATITNVQAFLTDTAASANLKVCLLGITDSSAYILPGCASTTGSPGNTSITFNVSAVQGAGTSYALRVTSQDDAGSTAVAWPGTSLMVRTAY